MRHRSRISSGKTISAAPDHENPGQGELDLAAAMIAARTRARMTQKQVAEAMGTAKTVIARLEGGHSHPTTTTLRRFAQATNSKLRISFDPMPSGKRRHTMTDTLTRSDIVADRRRFLGGTMSLAGLLGFGNVPKVTAQEATAAAKAADDYVWTPPDWENEPRPFSVLERGENTVLVETIDGQFEVPKNPQRMVFLFTEYVKLIQLGVTEGFVATAVHPVTEEFYGSRFLEPAELEKALAKSERMTESWEPDLELITTLEPDLVFGLPGWVDEYTYDYISQLSPMIRASLNARMGLRTLGQMFDRESTAEDLISGYEEVAVRARELVQPALADKKVAVLGIGSPDVLVYGSHEISQESDYDPGKIVSNGIIAVLFRDLALTPSSFVESTMEANNRISQVGATGFTMSHELIDKIDADYICVAKSDEEQSVVDEFLNHPVTQSTYAARQNQIFTIETSPWDSDIAYEEDLLRQVTEAITGDPFE